MRRFLFTLAACVLSASSLFAQTAPCDLPAVTAGTVIAGQPMTVLACHTEKDANGTPITITGWALYDGTVRMTPAMVPDTVVSPTNGRQFSVVMTAPSTASVHTYTLAVLTAVGEGPKSAPFVLTVNLAPALAVAPTKLIVR